MPPATTTVMQFAPFASEIDFNFFTALAHHKINHDKLDVSARRVLGLYELKASDEPAKSCRMQVHPNALTADGYVYYLKLLLLLI